MDFNQQLSQQEAVDLYKALTTGDYGKVGGPDNQVGGSALIPESLENALRTLTYNEQNLKLWKDIKKEKAFSPIEEYNIIDSYGEDLSAFQYEGLNGNDTTGNYERRYEKIKCLITERSVSDFMNRVRSIPSDAEAIATQNGMLYLMGKAETALFYGDSSLASDGKEGAEWDGIMKKADEGNTIDLKGEYLTDKTLNKASESIMNNYGIATKAYMPIPVSRVFSEQYYPNQRALMNTTAGEIVAGTTVTQFNSVGGTMDVIPNVMMQKGLKPLDPKQAADGRTAPTPPTVKAEANGTTEEKPFEEGTYRYAVVAYNSSGRSVAVESDPVAITGETNTDGIKLTITNSSVQLYAPEYFVIYRTEKDKNTYYEIARIPATTSQKSGTTEFVDKNETLPNTATAIVGDFRDDNIVFKQLTPMYKLPYAMVSPMRRFGIVLYGAPIVYAPKRFVVIKNIKVQ